MTPMNIIAIVITIIAVASIIGIKILNMKKNNEEITFDIFVDRYSNTIISVLQNVIQIIQINIKDFENKEEYVDCILNMTIDSIKEGTIDVYTELTDTIGKIDNDVLINGIKMIMDKYEVEIYSVLNSNQIDENKELYSKDVIIALDSEESEG